MNFMYLLNKFNVLRYTKLHTVAGARLSWRVRQLRAECGTRYPTMTLDNWIGLEIRRGRTYKKTLQKSYRQTTGFIFEPCGVVTRAR